MWTANTSSQPTLAFSCFLIMSLVDQKFLCFTNPHGQTDTQTHRRPAPSAPQKPPQVCGGLGPEPQPPDSPPTPRLSFQLHPEGSSHFTERETESQSRGKAAGPCRGWTHGPAGEPVQRAAWERPRMERPGGLPGGGGSDRRQDGRWAAFLEQGRERGSLCLGTRPGPGVQPTAPHHVDTRGRCLVCVITDAKCISHSPLHGGKRRPWPRPGSAIPRPRPSRGHPSPAATPLPQPPQALCTPQRRGRGRGDGPCPLRASPAQTLPERTPACDMQWTRAPLSTRPQLLLHSLCLSHPSPLGGNPGGTRLGRPHEATVSPRPGVTRPAAPVPLPSPGLWGGGRAQGWHLPAQSTPDSWVTPMVAGGGHPPERRGPGLGQCSRVPHPQGQARPPGKGCEHEPALAALQGPTGLWGVGPGFPKPHADQLWDE